MTRVRQQKLLLRLTGIVDRETRYKRNADLAEVVRALMRFQSGSHDAKWAMESLQYKSSPLLQKWHSLMMNLDI